MFEKKIFRLSKAPFYLFKNTIIKYNNNNNNYYYYIFNKFDSFVLFIIKDTFYVSLIIIYKCIKLTFLK